LWNRGVLTNMDGALLTILDALHNPSPTVAEQRFPLSRKGRGLEDRT
jgi:hypothetical protein